MQSRGSSNRLSSSSSSRFQSRIFTLMLCMLATMASFYVAGRLWQDAENRVYVVKELDRRVEQGNTAISVDDTLKIIDCREKQKRLDALQLELDKARQGGFIARHFTVKGGSGNKKRLLAVVGIITRFGRKKNRDAIRRAWMSTGAALKKLEDEKGIIIRFVIGRSPNKGDRLEKEIEQENKQTNDIIILKDHVETLEELSNKPKLFFIHAAEHWDAEFYVKVNDDIYVNIDSLGTVLANHLDTPRVYIGCMKSGEVFTEQTNRWYEPDWWKFGDAKSYFRHASGEMYAISRALAHFILINRSILRSYAHDDVSVGSWFIGLDVKHAKEGKFCCSQRSSGAVCAAA
ncbi:hydroxyproline O-galactosyltransferase HPGT1-like [Apium graveolens]|uniref:hydroxyproline O-galactosyltransferase HPGT1-like n=1 Tax=Apium graveolens TaxID=4045 RepID=UPI003D7B615B